MSNNWRRIERWDLEDAADGAEMMIVEDGAGGRYLLAKLRRHIALPATWTDAIGLLPTDTRATPEADAGLDCPMQVMDRALAGYDESRPVMYNWPASLIHNIANIAE